MNDMTLDVGYVGNVNKRQVGYDPINSALTPGPGPIQPRRLLPDFGDLDGGNNKFNSMYNSHAGEPGEALQQGIANECKLYLGPRR